MRSWVTVVLALVAACTTPTSSDAGLRDAAMDGSQSDVPVDAGRSDVLVDGGLDARDVPAPTDVGRDGGPDSPAASDAGRDVGASDGGADAGMDGGAVCGMNRFGVVDSSTTDVRGDEFGRQTFDLVFCRAPLMGTSVRVRFRARITAPGTEFPWDLFGTGVWVNGIGDYRDTLMTWSYIMIAGAAFTDYELVLPADIDRNGTVDWREGRNVLEVTTWSGYNDRPSSTGVDMLEVIEP